VQASVVGNKEELDLGHIEPVLHGLGFHIEIRIREDSIDLSDVVQSDLVLLLGSSWSLTESWVREKCQQEISLIHALTARGVPMLGICFGAQLLSSAFGGVVSRNSSPEIGWSTVGFDDTNPVIAGEWMQWHYDGFSCPTGATTLASNSFGVQAISIARSLGVQFHPEVDEQVLDSWLSKGGAAELETLGRQPSDLLSLTNQRTKSGLNRFSDLVNAFLEGDLGVSEP
jgi:GMP synthase-like glutamine amidotransferase